MRRLVVRDRGWRPLVGAERPPSRTSPLSRRRAAVADSPLELSPPPALRRRLNLRPRPRRRRSSPPPMVRSSPSPTSTERPCSGAASCASHCSGSSDQREADSICNPRSIYGNERSPTSIRNKEGLHGRPEGGSLFEPYYNSEFSAYNANATNPPMIVFGPGNQVGWLTANVSQFGNFAIDPDTLLFHLGSAS